MWLVWLIGVLCVMSFWNELREDIRSVFARDPSARTTWEIVLTYPGIHALILHRLAHRLWLAQWFGLARWMSTVSRFLTGIEIHPGAQIGRRFFIDHGMGVVIGETAEIADDVTLYHGVTLGGTSWYKGKRHPTLENGVVVGAGAKILGPIVVGAGARIGSNSVVTRAVPAGATMVGNPARIVAKGIDPHEEAKKDIARRMGFDAYGTSRDDGPDPVLVAIRALLDHMQATDRRMNGMCKALHELTSSFKDAETPALKAEDFGVIVEEIPPDSKLD